MSKRRLTLFVMMMLLGVFAIINSASNSRLQGVQGSDFVQHVAAGLCLGCGFGILVGSQIFRELTARGLRSPAHKYTNPPARYRMQGDLLLRRVNRGSFNLIRRRSFRKTRFNVLRLDYLFLGVVFDSPVQKHRTFGGQMVVNC